MVEEDPPYIFDITTNISTGIPLQELSCSTHDVNINYNGPAGATMTLDEQVIIQRIERLSIGVSPKSATSIFAAKVSLFFHAIFSTFSNGTTGAQNRRNSAGVITPLESQKESSNPTVAVL